MIVLPIAAYNIWRRKHLPGNSWTPAQLTSLKGWYRADSLITNIGGEVDVWGDKSGNGNDLSAPSSGERPTFVASGFNGGSQPYVEGDGTTEWLRDTAFDMGTDTTELTIAVIVNGPATNPGLKNPIIASMFNGNPELMYLSYNVSDVKPNLTGPGFVGSAGISTFALTPSLIVGAWDGANQYIYIDGVQEDTDANANGAILNNSAFSLFNISTDGSEANIQIAEAIVMRKSIPAPELTLLTAYAVARYGI